MPAIYHEGSWLGNATDPEVLVKDTVGWTGKNLLKNTATSRTVSGVTFTVNADGSITVNGTATADAVFVVNDNFIIPTDNYILSSHEISDGNNIHYSVVKMPGNTVLKEVKGTDEQPFTVNYSDYSYLKFTIWVRSGTTVSNKTAYPMIRRADITDPTYEPYHESVQNQLNAQGVLGAKNSFNFDTPTVTSQGITFENNEGIITANGTSSESGAFPFIECRKTIPAGTYIATGCPSGGGDVVNPNKYQIAWRLNDGSGQLLGVEYGDGITFTLDQSSVVNVRCMTSKNMTVSNLVFKPMLRLASDPDDTYVPYAMTNRELTEEKINIADLKTVVSASSDFADFKTRIASL